MFFLGIGVGEVTKEKQKMWWDWYILSSKCYWYSENTLCIMYKTFQKYTYRGMGVLVCTWTISFPLEMEKFCSTVWIWISIQNERNPPVLGDYDNKVVRISLNLFGLLLKVNESLYIHYLWSAHLLKSFS